MAIIRGTNRSDRLVGTADTDSIFGLAGDDFINGLAGNDLLFGDDDNDTILGGLGNDTLRGSSGNDTLSGESGNDFLFGGAGDDQLDGGAGNDFLDAAAGNDVVDGNSGDDFLSGGDGDDAMRGDDGNDRVDGDAGNDVLLGETGDDHLRGGTGDDVLDGDRALRIFALGDRNQLIAIDPNSPSQPRNLTVTGINGNLIGMDIRPADGKLYGLTDSNQVYQINVQTGAATVVSTLNLPFQSGKLSGVDFNPVPDRLRVVGSNDQNFRINVDTGAVADFDANIPGIQSDRALSYAPSDINAGKDPTIVANAYTQSFPPSPDPNRRTTLYAIDSNLDVLVRQGGLNFPDNPPSPNEGQLFTVGKLGVDFSDNAGFDILSAPNGQNVAIAVSNAKLYRIDLNTGAAKELGTIGNGRANFFGLAITGITDPNIRGNDKLYGGDGNDFLSGGGGEDLLHGKAGNDTLTGNEDDDVLVGGQGNDSFVFASDTGFNTARLGIDRIQDFAPGIDKVVLDQTTFGALRPDQIAIAANDAIAQANAGLIVYSQASGRLFFNANGAETGLGNGGLFARLDNRPTLTANDFAIVA